MTCPICGKKTEAASRPFCSKRCADIDLGRWLGDGYRIGGAEGDPAADVSETEPTTPPDRSH